MTRTAEAERFWYGFIVAMVLGLTIISGLWLLVVILG